MRADRCGSNFHRKQRALESRKKLRDRIGEKRACRWKGS